MLADASQDRYIVRFLAGKSVRFGGGGAPRIPPTRRGDEASVIAAPPGGAVAGFLQRLGVPTAGLPAAAGPRHPDAEAAESRATPVPRGDHDQETP
jgi:hypothetical protein